MIRLHIHLTAFCLLIFSNLFISVAWSQDSLKAPDCSKLSPSQCTKQSLEWAERLTKARNVGGGWSAGCTQDIVTLEWTCFTSKFFSRTSNGGLRVEHNPVFGYCFSGALNDHPGRNAVIRIGQNQPIRYGSTLVCGETAELIINQLLTEVDGATRGNVWPGKTQEFTFNSTGFPAAFEALKSRVKNPRP